MELADKIAESPDDIFLVDVRVPRERMRTGSIDGAEHIPLDELEDRADGLPRDKEIILIDWNGRMAHAAAGKLRKLSLENASPLDGGLMLWRGELV
jgi:rhodanese-related sulfurtransferase